MKKIFVTVGEYLENGGELKEGRKIYVQSSLVANSFDEVSSNFNRAVIGDNLQFFYIQIDVTPHYV